MDMDMDIDDISFEVSSQGTFIEGLFEEKIQLMEKGNIQPLDKPVAPLEELMNTMEANCDDEQSIIRLYDDRKVYTPKELEQLKTRDFKMRLFLSNLSVKMNSVWLRNHHTDNVEHVSNFTYIRDLFKAALLKNRPASKATLTILLTTLMNMEISEYNSFVTVLAAGLSEKATHTCFEKDLMKNAERKYVSVKRARANLLVLMDILLTKMKVKIFLLERNNSNIYRLEHCKTKGDPNIWSYMNVVFAFMLQTGLTFFVITHIFATPWDEVIGCNCETSTDEDCDCIEEPGMSLLTIGKFFLATFGTIYSYLIAYPEVTTCIEALELYQNICIFQMMDICANVFLPSILVIAGFFVIIKEDNFIEVVLNSAAILFIPEIDDRLPRLLGYDEKAIIENFLSMEAKNEYHHVDLSKAKEIVEKKKLGMEFDNYFLTNEKERGRDARKFHLYTPFIVKTVRYAAADNDLRPFLRGSQVTSSLRESNNSYEECRSAEIDPSNHITMDCLITKIEWKYTAFGDNNTTKPRIGWLRLTKLHAKTKEEKVVTIDCRKFDKIDLCEETYDLPQGIYIITSFAMSSTIVKLTLCGSGTANDFIKAIDYYSLFEMTSGARKLLKYSANKECKGSSGCFNIC